MIAEFIKGKPGWGVWQLDGTEVHFTVSYGDTITARIGGERDYFGLFEPTVFEFDGVVPGPGVVLGGAKAVATWLAKARQEIAHRNSRLAALQQAGCWGRLTSRQLVDDRQLPGRMCVYVNGRVNMPFMFGLADLQATPLPAAWQNLSGICYRYAGQLVENMSDHSFAVYLKILEEIK